MNQSHEAFINDNIWRFDMTMFNIISKARFSNKKIKKSIRLNGNDDIASK
jgi:hypothetical protein